MGILLRLLEALYERSIHPSGIRNEFSGRLDDIFVFIRIVDEKSITGAARALHMTPSAVSRRLARLESELQFRLIHRSTHHLSLTEADRIFYEHCLKGIGEIDLGKNIAEDAASGLSGALRVH